MKTDIDAYNKKQYDDIRQYLDPYHKYTFEFNDDYATIYDKSKVICRFEYQIIGTYQRSTGIFAWAWANPLIEKSKYQILDHITKAKSEYIDKYIKHNKQANRHDIDLYHYYVSHSIFYINKDMINELIYMTLYMTRALWILPNIDNEDDSIIQYVAITKLIQIK